MHQEPEGDFINLTLAIILDELNHKYKGVIYIPKINMILNFEITSIIPISKIVEKKLPCREILPHLIQIRIKKDKQTVSLKKEEYEFFFNIIFIYTVDAHFKIQQKLSRKSALEPKTRISTIGKTFPVGVVASETYILAIRKEDIPFSLRQKALT